MYLLYDEKDLLREHYHHSHYSVKSPLYKNQYFGGLKGKWQVLFLNLKMILAPGRDEKIELLIALGIDMDTPSSSLHSNSKSNTSEEWKTLISDKDIGLEITNECCGSI